MEKDTCNPILLPRLLFALALRIDSFMKASYSAKVSHPPKEKSGTSNAYGQLTETIVRIGKSCKHKRVYSNDDND